MDLTVNLYFSLTLTGFVTSCQAFATKRRMFVVSSPLCVER